MSRILVLFVFSFVILAGCQNHMSELGKQTTPKDHLSHLKNKGTAKPTVNTISSKNWSNAAEQVQRARVIQALKDQQLPLPTNDYLINIVQNVGVVLKNYDSSADLNTIIVNTYNDLSSFNQKTNLVTQDPFTNKKNEGDVNVKLLSVVNNGKSTSFIYEDDQLHPSIYMSKETNGKWVFKDKLLISKSEDVVTMGLIIYQLAADESKGTYTIFAMTYDENGNLTDKEPLPVTFKAEDPDMSGVLPDPAVHPVNTDQGQGVLITGDISTDQDGADANNQYYILPKNPYMVQTLNDPSHVLDQLNISYIDSTNHTLWVNESVSEAKASFIFTFNPKSTSAGVVNGPNTAKLKLLPINAFAIGNGNTLTVTGLKDGDPNQVTGTELKIVDSSFNFKKETDEILLYPPGEVMSYSNNHLYMWSPVLSNNKIFVRLTDVTLPHYLP